MDIHNYYCGTACCKAGNRGDLHAVSQGLETLQTLTTVLQTMTVTDSLILDMPPSENLVIMTYICRWGSYKEYRDDFSRSAAPAAVPLSQL